jgi:hypothetical protein
MFNTACPGLLGSPAEFRKHYENPILQVSAEFRMPLCNVEGAGCTHTRCILLRALPTQQNIQCVKLPLVVPTQRSYSHTCVPDRGAMPMPLTNRLFVAWSAPTSWWSCARSTCCAVPPLCSSSTSRARFSRLVSKGGQEHGYTCIHAYMHRIPLKSNEQQAPTGMHMPLFGRLHSPPTPQPRRWSSARCRPFSKHSIRASSHQSL